MKATEKIIFVIAICLVVLIFIVGIFALAESTGFLPNTNGDKLTTSTQNLEPFKEIEIQANINLEIVKSNDYSIKLSQTEGGSAPSVQAKVENSKLTLGSSDRSFQIVNPLNVVRTTKVTVYTPEIATIKLFSAGAVYGQDLTADDLYVEVNGSGTIELNNIKAKKVSSAIFGSGSMILSGNVEDHNAQIVGSGEIKTSNLKATTGSVEITGSGDVTINATRSLNATIQGSGQIKYYGDPSITQKITGSGSIYKV